jgi:lipopolysaccharide transport system ATP-binding protein
MTDSMSDTIISVENLSKKYRLRHQTSERYTALRDVIANKAKSLFGRSAKANASQASHEDFWALKDVSFEIKRGEVVGIIGRNGAGKSTLLKILSRITEPTEGRITLRGRVASLLEVGTGFHPELTGRENIFLNGAILGMTRAEIRKKFDEIVAFAEVEKFLDTPVKRYSSGMYVRLAFAVAAHLEPEILIVDEVLAVGDAQFQKKCLGKIETVAASEGRTVLFVTHNMAVVKELCRAGIYLVNGKVHSVGPAETTIRAYLESDAQNHRTRAHSGHGDQFQMVDCKICGKDSDLGLRSVFFGSDYDLKFGFVGTSSGRSLGPMVQITDQLGRLVSSICGIEEGIEMLPLEGSWQWTIKIPRLSLLPGRYFVSIRMYGTEPQPFFEAQDALEFDVEPAIIRSASRAYRSDHGLVRICSEMTVVSEKVK